jgi:hypothetical protein
MFAHLLYQDVVFGEKASVRVYDRSPMGKAVRDNAVTWLGDDTIHCSDHIRIGKREVV